LALRMLATVMGGFGIFCLHAAFGPPHAGLRAIVFLGTAMAITLLSRSKHAFARHVGRDHRHSKRAVT
jgi:hypothetical protein